MVVSNKNIISLVFSFCFFLVANISSAVAEDGLGPQNFGFEDGITPWSIDSSAEFVGVVDAVDSSSEYLTYIDNGITFEPFNGIKMLRLGTPKNKRAKMEQGANTVSQTFVSHNESMVISFRLFGWEHREERDTFTVDVKGADATITYPVSGVSGDILSIDMFGDIKQTCDFTPCIVAIYSGDRGELINTGWKRIIVSGLTIGETFTVSYSLDGVNDSGHPVWAYVDAGNTNPVADFTVSRESTIEGNVSRFIDASYDDDPGDEITKRIWKIKYSDGSTQSRENAKEISVISSNAGTVTATLEVFDRFGGSDTVTSGDTRKVVGTAIDKTVPSITFEESEIFVNKLLSYNVVAGSKGNMITARYAKPGWDDQIVATWSITDGGGGGTLGTPENTQLPIPMMLKGMASIPFDAPAVAGTTEISLTLTDSASGKSAERTITVVIKPKSAFPINQDADGNDSIAALELIDHPDDKLLSGTVTLGHLNKKGDVDYYRVTDALGNNFPVGSEVYLRLRNTTTDHDMFLVGQSAVISEGETDALASAYSARLGRMYSSRLGRMYSSRLGRMYSSRLEEGDNESETVVFTNPQAAEYGWDQAVANHLLHSMYLRDSDIDPFSTASIGKGFDFEQFPLSESIFLPIPEGIIGEKDIDINETVLGDLTGSGHQVELFSANDGYEDEVMLVKITSEDNTYVAVASDSGFGSPYSIQVENSIPTNLEHIATEACKGNNPLVTNGNNVASGLITTENPGDEVMYVVNPQRMAAKFGQDRWDSLYTELKSLAKTSNGKILAIHELATYADMDTSPCQVEKANLVAQTIRNAINANRGNADSVTLVGGDDILPFYRVPDPSDYTERDYVAHTELSPKSPMYSAMFNSYILTDKYYSNNYVLANSTTKLLLPMWGVSRLVETPEEMLSAIEHHKTNTASVEMKSAVVSAYDVVLDSGKDIYNTLSKSLYGDTDGGIDLLALPVEFALNKPWSAFDLRCLLMGAESAPGVYWSGCEPKDVVDVVSLNGHFTHDTLISQTAYEEPIKCALDPEGAACLALTCAEGLTTQECFEWKYLTSQRVDASANGNISGNYVYSPGCHAGLNVPGSSSHTSSTQYSDFPSSYVSNGATYLGGTGYGIAGTNTNSFSEKLMSWHTKTLAQGGKVGMLAADADTFYMLDRINSLSPYDIKAMYQSTLYGFANTKVIENNPVVLETINKGCDTYSPSSLNLTIEGGVVDAESDVPHSLSPVCTDSGVYFEGDAGTKSEIDRPIQPLTQITLTATEKNVRGILIEQAKYTQLAEPIDALFLTPTTGNDAKQAEQSLCSVSRYWPSKLVDHSYSDTRSVINFVSGQYVCDSSESGYQRLYDSATIKILRSVVGLEDDITPPVINAVEPQLNESSEIVYYVDATDSSGITQVRLTIYLEDGIETIIRDVDDTDVWPYAFVLTPAEKLLAEGKSSAVTVIDGANNITIASSKGRGMKQVLVNIEPTSTPKLLTATIENYGTRKAASKSMSYIWDFGDGHFETGKVFDGAGINADKLIESTNGETAELSTSSHVYDNAICDISVKFKVTDSSGGIGSDETTLNGEGDPAESETLLQDFPELANSDMTGCSIESSGTSLTLRINLLGEVTDKVQYRLYVDSNNDGEIDLKSTYDNGKWTGSTAGNNLNVTQGSHYVEYSFDAAETGWTPGMPLNWYMKTQSGVPGAPMKGQTDDMPDSGSITYTGQ